VTFSVPERRVLFNHSVPERGVLFSQPVNVGITTRRAQLQSLTSTMRSGIATAFAAAGLPVQLRT